MDTVRRVKMLVCLCTLVLLSVVSSPKGLAQLPVHRLSPLAEVDSLLLVRNHAEARIRLEAIASRAVMDGDVVERYRTICALLDSALAKEDTTIAPLLEARQASPNRYALSDAGPAAAGCYAEFLGELQAGRLAAARERSILAEFLREGHVRREKERLLRDLEHMRFLIQQNRFDEAGEVLDAFRRESVTSTYRAMRDTLEGHYLHLEQMIAEAKFQREYESGRVPVSGRASVGAGVMLLRWQSVPYQFFLFREAGASGGETFRYGSDESALTLHPLPLYVEGGYHLTPQVYIGGFFGRATMHATGYLWRHEAPFTFRADFRLDLFLLTARYYLDARTGLRPFVGFTLGHAQWTMTPAGNPFTTLTVAGATEQATVVGSVVGAQYIPFDPFPLTLSASFDGFVRISKATLTRGIVLGLEIRAGLLL